MPLLLSNPGRGLGQVRHRDMRAAGRRLVMATFNVYRLHPGAAGGFDVPPSVAYARVGEFAGAIASHAAIVSRLICPAYASAAHSS